MAHTTRVNDSPWEIILCFPVALIRPKLTRAQRKIPHDFLISLA